MMLFFIYMNLNSGRKSLSISLMQGRLAMILSLNAKLSIFSALIPGLVSSSSSAKTLHANSFVLRLYKSFNEKAV